METCLLITDSLDWCKYIIPLYATSIKAKAVLHQKNAEHYSMLYYKGNIRYWEVTYFLYQTLNVTILSSLCDQHVK